MVDNASAQSFLPRHALDQTQARSDRFHRSPARKVIRRTVDTCASPWNSYPSVHKVELRNVLAVEAIRLTPIKPGAACSTDRRRGGALTLSVDK